MAVDWKNLHLIVSLAERRAIKRNGRIIEIGAQQISNSVLRAPELIRRAEAVFGAEQPYEVPALRPSMRTPGQTELLDDEAPLARDLWTALGFEYATIDLGQTPGAVPLDLNYDSLPDNLKGRYDLITNLGTTEHICNQLNAFKAIRQAGCSRLSHDSPSSCRRAAESWNSQI